MVASPPDPAGRPPVGLRPPTRKGAESARGFRAKWFWSKKPLKKKKQEMSPSNPNHVERGHII